MNNNNIEYDKGWYQTVYPPANNYCADCFHNVEWDTAPSDMKYRKTTLGPTSLKQLYWGPWYYPLQYMKVPVDTLYGEDNSLRWPTSPPSGNKDPTLGMERKSYQRPVYPFRNRMVREVHPYSPEILPLPDIDQWTRYKVKNEGTWNR